MAKKPTKPTGPETAPKADLVNALFGKVAKNPAIRTALLEAMRKGKARRRSQH